MASASLAFPLTCTVEKRVNQPSSDAFFRALPLRPSKRTVLSKPNTKSKFGVEASLKEKAVRGLTAATLTASMVIPEVALAAGSDVTPSLKNFLLSIAAGGVVLAALFVAVIGVANFDPVKRI